MPSSACLRGGAIVTPTALFTTPTGPGAGAGLGSSSAAGGGVGGGATPPPPPPPPPEGPGGSRTNGPPPEGGVGGGAAGGMGPHPNSFHTPEGHYSNLMDNVHAATLRLENIMVPKGTEGQETREAIELLKTALTQQTLYPAFPDASRLHSTPFNSGTRSRHDESHPANSTSARRREQERNKANVPTASRDRKSVV